MLLFSLIIPTRGRPEGLRRLLDSLYATTEDRTTIETIAVIDEDDAESRAFSYPDLSFHPVIVPAGLKMGELNLAGYRAARGKFLMLLNDDVVVRTRGWDTQLKQVLEYYGDGVVLAHVNDLLFGDTLCTFPALTREFCEIAGGICRPEYRRYRIDDHIHEFFDLIHQLGHTRRVYLPDVIFEHSNVSGDAGGIHRYVPDPAIHEEDTRTFEALAPERRCVALACVERIEGSTAGRARAALIETRADSLALRRREHAVVWRSSDVTGTVGSMRHWPTDPESGPPVSRLAAIANRLRIPSRTAYRVWDALARAAAQCRFLSSFSFAIPPVLLDQRWYAAMYPESGRHKLPALLHYLRYGSRQGYNPNPHFDTKWYLAVNPDVAESGLNPLVHFVRYGAREGRNPNLFFDIHYYRLQQADAASVRINPLEHFLSSPPSARRSPNAGLSLEQYLASVEPAASRARKNSFVSPAPLSIIIPTRDRADTLEKTLEACSRYSAGLEVEFIVVDDGSTDATPQLLREMSVRQINLSWCRSLPAGGPGRARNVGATRARYPVLLFIGDDIRPEGPDFFRVHALRHAEYPDSNFSVLGNIQWPRTPDFPATFTMARILEDGSQFAFSRLSPGEFASWQFFYTSNISVKKSLVSDWMADGFDPGFPGAALEDMEFAYRRWRSPEGLRILYEPTAVAFHHHPYDLDGYLARQEFVGKSLHRMLERHPEVLDEYGLRPIVAALREPICAGNAKLLDDVSRSINSIEVYARELEKCGDLGRESWHPSLLSALFELRMHDGYAAFSGVKGNLAAARVHMLRRLLHRVPALPPALKSQLRASSKFADRH
jgi:glycosyltransferase involved in cell wall biosynthesis